MFGVDWVNLMDTENTTLKRLLEFDKISTDEYELLLSDKSSWNSEDSNFNDAKYFWEVFSKIKNILDTENIRETLKLSPRDSLYNFSYIMFSDMDSSPIYEEYIYPDYDDDGHDYAEATYFSHCVFYGIANFSHTSFSNEVIFNDAKFIKKADFSESSFVGDVYFNGAIFQSEVTFENSECTGIFDFSNVSFRSLLLDKSDFPHASYLRLYGWDNDRYEDIGGMHLSAKNFPSQETVRIIKAHFEKQNNIIESNKYFAIEQEIYTKILKIYKNKPHRLSILATLCLNKWVSNFGTDWIRPLFVMFIFGFFASFFYIVFSNNPTILNSSKDILLWTGGGFMVSIVVYLLYHYKEGKLLTLAIVSYICLLYFSQDFRLISNDISKLVNPLNIFKTKDYFEDIAPYGMFVKLIMATLIYQFIMAFRQNTRRK